MESDRIPRPAPDLRIAPRSRLTLRLLSVGAKRSARLAFQVGDGALGGAAEHAVAWRVKLLEIEIVVHGFLAPYTK